MAAILIPVVPSLTWGRESNLLLIGGRGDGLGGGEKNSPPLPRAIIPDARPLGTSENQDGRH